MRESKVTMIIKNSNIDENTMDIKKKKLENKRSNVLMACSMK